MVVDHMVQRDYCHCQMKKCEYFVSYKQGNTPRIYNKRDKLLKLRKARIEDLIRL